jgi:hypothetical protein
VDESLGFSGCLISDTILFGTVIFPVPGFIGLKAQPASKSVVATT